MDKFIVRQPKAQPQTSSIQGDQVSVPQSSSSSRGRSVRRRTTSVSVSESDSTSHDDDDADEDEGQPQRKKRQYRQKFRNAWYEKFPGLQCINNTPRCQVCDKSLSCNYNHIVRHYGSKTHIYKENVAKITPKIDTFMSSKQMSIKRSTKIAELKLVAFIHDHNLPFTLMDHLPKVIASAFTDSDIAKEMKISRTKATQLTKHQFTEEALINLKDLLKLNKLYSLIVDETTDVSTQKSLAVLIRFFDDASIKDRFLGLVRVEDATANGLFSAIIKLLEENDIPVANMIGFAADNASVMMGNKVGVQAKFREINPKIIIIGCICHSLHLCSSAAAEKLPKSIEEFLRSVINHFANSSKRIESFKEYQEFVDIKPRKLLKTSQTRWLSLQAAVDRVLVSWEALKLYFTNLVLSDEMRSVAQILENLRNPVYKVYFTFLSYALSFVNSLNKEFQSETCKIDVVLIRLTDLYNSFLRNYLKKEYLDKTPIQNINVEYPDNFIKIENMYFGAKVEQIIETVNIDKNELLKFRKNALAFYIELCKQIKKRINFNDPLLLFIKKFSPKEVVSGEHLSIVKILDFLPQLNGEIDVENLNSEYRLASSTAELQIHSNKDFEEFWCYAMEMKNGLNEYMFPNLSKVVKAIMTIPHSSAAAERLFSQLTLIKTKQRNRLEIDTCESIMHAKSLLQGKACYEFTPNQRLLKKM